MRDREALQRDPSLQQDATDKHRQVINLREAMEAAFREEKGSLKENVDVLISTLGFFLQQPDTYAEVSLRKKEEIR